MSDPKNHHHVPQFLLDGWCRSDGKLAVYTRKGGRLVVDWRAPKYTGFEPHLYSISALPMEDQQWVEREVMSRAVDGPAAVIHKRLLAGELSSFDSAARSDWTRFILAQWYRSPDQIAKLRYEGRAALLRALEARPEECEAVKGDAPERTLVEWVDKASPGLHEIVSMARVFPKLVADSEAGSVVINMRWEVLHLRETPTDLLTSDQPGIRIGGLKMRDCMIVVPLSPRALFVASHYDRHFRRFVTDNVARAANKSMVMSARSRVYASGPQHRPLVEKLLRR